MLLEKVILSGFRNYAREEITFSPEMNCIQGSNAEGKSNLLEAIYLISTGKSFRTSHLPHLIKHDQTEFLIEAHFSKDSISHCLRISYGAHGRKVLYNQTSYSSFLPLLGILPCVLLAPEDISIIMGAPAERRRFLDLHISQMDPMYIHHLGRYHKAMKQRNSLLKAKQIQGLDPWEQIMALSASYLIEKRIETLTSLEPLTSKTISFLSEEKEVFTCKYEKSFEGDNLLDNWHKNRKKELLLGTHRDDVHFLIQGQEVKTYCSEGQKRGCIAALRLAEWERFKTFFGSPPLFGIDDFGSHLDPKRSKLLKETLKNLGQTFLTAPSFQEEAYVLHVSNGTIKELPREFHLR